MKTFADHEADVVVIGGGLHGCAAALFLAQRRRRVVVLERRHVGRHASGINAGGVRTLGRDLAEVPLSLAGMDLWHSLATLVGDDCGFAAHGQVKVAETAAEFDQLAARAETLRRLGYTHEELVDAVQLRRLVPAISRSCVGALVAMRDGAADPYRTTLAFKRRAEALGAAFREGEGVTALERGANAWTVVTATGRYRAPIVVNAAGAWAGRIAALVGDDVPLRTRASMMIVTERLPRFIEPVIGAVGRKLSFKQTPSGTVLIGGGAQGRADLAREEAFVDFRALAESAAAAVALFPMMRGVRVVRSWCGIEAETPDRIPVIGFSPGAPGIIHSFGYSGHGFQLGPIVGRAVADLATTGATGLPIASFALARFRNEARAA